MPFFSEKLSEIEELIKDKLVNQVVSFLNNSFYQGKSQMPYIILFVSTREGEGKSLVSRIIAESIDITVDKTLLIQPDINEQSLPKQVDVTYRPDHDFADYSLEDLVSDNVCLKDYRYVFVEIPALIGADLPVKLIQQSNLSLLVLKTSRTWNKADDMALSTYKNISKREIFCFVNGCEYDALESIIGEVPKERSKLRKVVKRFANKQFKRNNF